MAKRKSYYEILGVSSDAGEKEIRKAYRRAIIANHPDVNQQSSERAQKRTRDLNAALEVLTKPELRKQYDEKLARRAAAQKRQAENRQPPNNQASSSDGYGAQFQSDDDFWDAFEQPPTQPEPAGARRNRYQKTQANRRPKRRSKQRNWRGGLAVGIILVPLLIGTAVLLVVRLGGNPSIADRNGGDQPITSELTENRDPPVTSIAPATRFPASDSGSIANRDGNDVERGGQPRNPASPSDRRSATKSNSAMGRMPGSPRSTDSRSNFETGTPSMSRKGERTKAPEAGSASRRPPKRPSDSSSGISRTGTSGRRIAVLRPRIPIPDEAERVLASEQFMRRYRSQIESANRQRGRERQTRLRDLAGEFLDLFIAGGEAAEEYVWLQAAHQSAIESGHPEFTTEVIEAYFARFEMDDVALCAPAVESWAEQLPKEGLTGQPLATRKRMLLDLILPVARQAHTKRDFERAVTLYNLANKNNESDDLLRAEIGRLRGQAITKTELTGTSPENSPIVERWWVTLGIHWCFELKAWKEGQQFFTRGGNANLAEAAKGELDDPATVTAQIQQGDQWRTLALSMPRHEISLLRRAEHWYKVGFANGGTVDQQKLAVRIRELQKRTRPALARIPFSSDEGRRHRTQWSAYLGQPVIQHNSIGMSFQLIPAGSFSAGTDGKSGQTMKHAIYLASNELSQDQYSRVMGENPSWFSAEGEGRARISGRTSNMPVEYVRYEDAVRYCEALSEMPREKAAGRSYRLPTEIEWEFACRAGTDSDYSFGNNDQLLFQYAWYNQNSEQFPHDLGRRKPNPFGLRDMHGNVWEWCTRSNFGPGETLSREQAAIRRGGGWASSPEKLVSGCRESGTDEQRHADCGFRIVLVAEPYQEAVAPNH